LVSQALLVLKCQQYARSKTVISSRQNLRLVRPDFVAKLTSQGPVFWGLVKSVRAPI
jgi:hypothetical protein